LRVYLGHDAPAVCRIAGRVSPSVQDAVILPPCTGAYGLPALLATLDAWLDVHPVRGDIDWIVGIDHARYLLLPWDRRLASDAFCRSLTAALFEQHFAGSGTPFADHQLRFAPVAFERPRLAALIANDVVRELTDFARRRGCRTVRITPAVTVVWNRFYGRWKKGTGVLALIDGPRLLRIGYDRGHVTTFSIQPFSETRSSSAPGDTTWVFPAHHPAAPDGDELALDTLAPDDDPRLAYALCGAI